MLRPVLPKLVQNEPHSFLVTNMRHRRNSIRPDLSRLADILIRNGQSRPHNIPTFENFTPFVLIDENFEKFQFSSRSACIDFKLFLEFVLFVFVNFGGDVLVDLAVGEAGVLLL